ncbi:MAG: SDR family oxidoreductase [Ignavibacteriales bacterium]|nr:SDR family oxidoreductase [Ignavibacteriales bacterium]
MPPRKRTFRKHHSRPRPQAGLWKQNKTALVTGASGGIGYDLATVFAENGYNVVLVARSEDKLLALANQAQQIFGVSAMVIAKDLTRPESPGEITRELDAAGVFVDILVNNAGFGLLGRFGYSDNGEELGMLQLNVVTPVHLTKLLLPAMLARGSGRILNVASIAGFQPGPFMTNYHATKAYLISFSLGLAEEVRDRGITVSVLCPGPMATGFRARAGIRRRALGGIAEMDSRVVARAAYEGLMAGRPLIVPGFFNKLGTVAVRFLSARLVSRIVASIQKDRMGGQVTVIRPE